jgi:riboflavin synthase
VDGVGRIKYIEPEGNSRIFTFEIPKKLARYIVEKGSIAVNGISLTVISIGDSYFTVGIIPYTWDHTMLHSAKVGDKVNIETDVIAKYVEKLLKK